MAVDYSERMICEKCGQEKSAVKAFFMRKDHTREPLCKDCLTMFINNKERSTFEWILEKFDVPYIEDEWIKIYNREMEKKGKVGSGAVLGKYLRLMNMTQYIGYTYADTEKLAFEAQKNKEAAAARAAANSVDASENLLKLQQQLDAGEISQAQFDTLNPINILANQESEFLEYAVAPGTEDEEAILKELEEEEIQMLRMKWGANYKPSQWIQMEEIYTKYENEYDLNVDREEALKQICKISVKENEALDVGDINGFKALSAAKDTLRKSAKFTEAQNKEENSKYLDSIGELVAFCEREGGIIEQIPHPDDYPQDDIDYAIKNMKSYYYDVVTNELGLGNMIEAYIKRLEQSEKEQEIDFETGLITTEEEEDKELAADMVADEFETYLEYGIEDEIAEILGDL